MPFVLLACSDIRAQKVNLELPFDDVPPSIEALAKTIEKTFSGEESAIKQSIGDTDVRPCEPFTVARLQRYVDVTQSWEDLQRTEQLQSYDQLYVFRKNTTKADISVQRELPQPRRSQFFCAYSNGASREERNDPMRSRYASGVNGHHSMVGLPSSGMDDALRPSGNRMSESQTPMSAGRRGIHSSVRPVRNNYVSERTGIEEVDAARDGWPGPALTNGSPSSGVRGGHVPSFDPTGPVGTRRYDSSDRSLAVAVGVGNFPVYDKNGMARRYVEYLFNLADTTHCGRISLREFESIFRMCEMRFSQDVMTNLFQRFASARSHHQPNSAGDTTLSMTIDDFDMYARRFPVAVTVAYQRLTNQERAKAIQAAQHESSLVLDDLRHQKQVYENKLMELQECVQREETKRNALQADANEVNRQMESDYRHDEQRLLDKEISVFKYRECLQREEEEYERLAMERSRRTAHTEPHSVGTGGTDSMIRHHKGKYGYQY